MPSITPDAAAHIMERLRSRLGALAFMIVRDRHLADDVLQEVAVALLDHLGGIEETGHLERWLLRTTRHRAIDHLRRRKRHGQLTGAALDALEARVGTLDPGPRFEALERCLEGLSPYARQLFDLRYRKGIKGADLARRLDRNPNAVYVALSRLQARLSECMRQQGERRS